MASDSIFAEADDQYQLLVDVVENNEDADNRHKWEDVLVDCMENHKTG